MYGDSTDSEMAQKIDKALEMQTQESVEILVYQKSSKFIISIKRTNKRISVIKTDHFGKTDSFMVEVKLLFLNDDDL